VKIAQDRLNLAGLASGLAEKRRLVFFAQRRRGQDGDAVVGAKAQIKRHARRLEGQPALAGQVAIAKIEMSPGSSGASSPLMKCADRKARVSSGGETRQLKLVSGCCVDRTMFFVALSEGRSSFPGARKSA
jgi:hypothetical protein